MRRSACNGVATASVMTASSGAGIGAGGTISDARGRNTYSAKAPSTSTPMRCSDGLRFGTPAAAQRSPGGVEM